MILQFQNLLLIKPSNKKCTRFICQILLRLCCNNPYTSTFSLAGKVNLPLTGRINWIPSDFISQIFTQNSYRFFIAFHAVQHVCVFNAHKLHFQSLIV